MKNQLLFAVVILAMALQPGTADAQFRRFPGRARPYPYYPWWLFVPPAPPIQPNVYPPYMGDSAVDALPPPRENRAVINILLPSTANDIWVDGVKMPSRETASRVFVSPPLEPGYHYTYTVRASWVERGNIITQEKGVVIGANSAATADFRQPPASQ